MNVDKSTSTVSLQKRENTWKVSVDENKIDVLFNHDSNESMCGKVLKMSDTIIHVL